jgi:hypothetical protein
MDIKHSRLYPELQERIEARRFYRNNLVGLAVVLAAAVLALASISLGL